MIPAGKRQKKHGGKKRPQAVPPPSIPTLPLPLPLQVFFAAYAPRFQYNPFVSASLEFYRLCNEFGWGKNNLQGRTARSNYYTALVRQFHFFYGSDVDDLEAWKRLCRAVRVDPIPDDLNACREAVYYTFVNIIDLLDLQTTGQAVHLFPSECALSEYTRRSRKIFPGNHPLAGTLLKYLLRHIVHPREGYDVSRSEGGFKYERREHR